jgi:hypothetical protein
MSEDPGIAEALSRLTNRTVALYDEVLAAGAAGSFSPFGCRALTAVRFDAAEADEPYADELARLVDAGAATARLYRRSERQHPRWPTAEPEWLGLAAWRSEEDAYDRASAEAAHERLLGPALSRLSYNLVRLRYGLVREDVWAA